MGKWDDLKNVAELENNPQGVVSIRPEVVLELIADAERAPEIEDPKDNREEIFKELNSYGDNRKKSFAVMGLAYAVSWIVDQEDQWRRTGSDTSPQRYFYWRLLRLLRGEAKLDIPKSPDVSGTVLN